MTALGRHWLTGVIRDELSEQQVEVIDLTPEVTTSAPVSSIIVSKQSASRTIVSLDAIGTQASPPPGVSARWGELAGSG